MYRIAQRIRPTGHRFFSTIKTLKQHEKQPFIPTLQQKQFIEWESLQDCKLLGTSGSGKTLSILQRVKHLVEDKDYNPNEMHILTFSRPTKMDIVNKIHTNNFHQVSQENVKTVDSFARYVLKELDQNYKDLSLLSLNFLSLLESDFDSAYPYLKDMKYIFVDEAQDLRHTQIKIIELLREKNESKICLVGDPCQSIYQFLGCDPSFLVNFPGETFQLTKNFRSTQNIVCFGEYFRNQSENKEDTFLSTDEEEAESLIKDKKKKEVEIYTGSSKQVEKKILKEIANYPGGKANIAILSPMASSRLASNIGLSWAANILTREKIPFIKQYKDSGLNAWKSQQNIKIDHVNLATYAGSKGLEWDFVILLDFSLFKHGTLPTLKEYMEDLNLYYVALTRARKKLLICHKKDTGLFEEIEDQNQVIDLNEELEEGEIDVDDIRSQFKNMDKTVKKFSTQETSVEKEDIDTEDEEGSSSRIIENMLHPLVREIDPELYQSNITTRAHIQEIEFDVDWLRKDKKIEESMTVTELVSSLDNKTINGLFENPEFSCEVQTEQIYEKQPINLYGIQNNEALFGIISENLLYQKLGIQGRDYTEKLINQDYVVCENDKLLNSLKKIFAEGKSPSQVYQMLRQKTLSFNTFNFLKKNFEQNGDFLYKLLIHGSTHRAIMSSLNSIKEVNSYKDSAAVAALEGNFQESEEKAQKNMDFYTVYNSILQYSFASKHNDYIGRAWNGTRRFVEDNKTYIDNLQLVADKLSEQGIFWETQVNVNYESILRGSIDLMDANNNIYEVKATRSTTKNHILQSLLYAIMVNKKAMDALERIQCDSSVINLIKGEIHRYKFSMPHKLLDDFMEENLNRSERLLKRPVYLYEIKAKQFQDQLYIYYLLIKDLKTQNNILDTFIKYPEYVPSSLEKSNDLMIKYNNSPTKLKVEKTLQKLFIKEKKPIFLSAPGCDEKGNLLGHLLPADSTIVEGTGFLKLLYPHLREYDYTELYKQAVQFDKGLEELEKQNGKDEIQKALLMSTIVMRNLSLLKDYIQEYSISFYV